MTKILSGAAYTALKEKADNFDSVVNSIVEKSEDLKPEDITAEVIEAAISNDGGGACGNSGCPHKSNCGLQSEAKSCQLAASVTELEGTVETLNSTVTELTTERDTLQTRVEELEKLPGAKSVAKIAEGDATGLSAQEEIVAFAEAHAGDTALIAAKIVELGLNQKSK